MEKSDATAQIKTNYGKRILLKCHTEIAIVSLNRRLGHNRHVTTTSKEAYPISERGFWSVLSWLIVISIISGLMQILHFDWLRF